jgi:hypothetical protein
MACRGRIGRRLAADAHGSGKPGRLCVGRDSGPLHFGAVPDEAKDIRDKAEAMRAYARQAKNKDLEVDAAEIRIRAERRLGELIRAQKTEGPGLNKGAAGSARSRSWE